MTRIASAAPIAAAVLGAFIATAIVGYFNFHAVLAAMAPVGWRYGGLCMARSSMPELPQPFAEIHSVAARDRAEAVALDEKTKPEPQDILDMYEACAAFSVKGQGRWIWLTPKNS